MNKSNLKPTLALGCICLVSALLLSVINMFTAPEIARREEQKALEALTEVLPGGSNFQKIELNDKYPEEVIKAYSADGGFVFCTVGKGNNGDIVVMIGVDTEGKITGTAIISDRESEAYKERVYSVVAGKDTAYKGQTLDSFEPVLVAKSTRTSEGFATAVRAALQAYEIANGGTVDTRPPEVILQENCNLALGTEGKTFVQWYSSSDELGDAKVYITDGGAVISSGKHFVGYPVGSDTPYGEPSAEALAATASTYEVYASTTRISLSDYQGIGSAVKYAYKLADGSYLLRLERKGYKYAPAPIVIELVIDVDGKIASCVTVSHSESAGYGYPCGTPEYYEQYNGKDGTNYTEVPNITAEALDNPPTTGGATQTSNGYKDAIRQGFAAFDKFTALEEGGNA